MARLPGGREKPSGSEIASVRCEYTSGGLSTCRWRRARGRRRLFGLCRGNGSRLEFCFLLGELADLLFDVGDIADIAKPRLRRGKEDGFISVFVFLEGVRMVGLDRNSAAIVIDAGN